jgi:hypothetical protein
MNGRNPSITKEFSQQTARLFVSYASKIHFVSVQILQIVGFTNLIQTVNKSINFPGYWTHQ